MKTIAQSLTVSAAIYSIIFILIASFAFGSETNENQTIDRVSVETEFAFEEEAYVDDIPFNTYQIALKQTVNMVAVK